MVMVVRLRPSIHSYATLSMIVRICRILVETTVQMEDDGTFILCFIDIHGGPFSWQARPRTNGCEFLPMMPLHASGTLAFEAEIHVETEVCANLPRRFRCMVEERLKLVRGRAV